MIEFHDPIILVTSENVFKDILAIIDGLDWF